MNKVLASAAMLGLMSGNHIRFVNKGEYTEETPPPTNPKPLNAKNKPLTNGDLIALEKAEQKRQRKINKRVKNV